MKKKRVTGRVCGVVGLLLLAPGVKAVTISAESPGSPGSTTTVKPYLSPAVLTTDDRIVGYCRVLSGANTVRWDIFYGSPKPVVTVGRPCNGSAIRFPPTNGQSIYLEASSTSGPAYVSLTLESLRTGKLVYMVSGLFIAGGKPGSSCSANVNTAVNFRGISGGVTPGKVVIVSPGENAGDLSFTPDYAILGKGALRNPVSGTSLTYRVSGAIWDMAHGRWTGSSSVSHSLMLDTPPLDVKAGQYKGTLTVTINCS